MGYGIRITQKQNPDASEDLTTEVTPDGKGTLDYKRTLDRKGNN